MQDNMEDFNYECDEFCPECNSEQTGTMYHAPDSAGMATPIIWQCARCVSPPYLVGVWRAINRFKRREMHNIKYWLRTTRAERNVRAANKAIRKALLDQIPPD